ncbi:MAG: extracellular solute-binding protein [Spirochaetaceae bacterium]
MKKVLLMLVSLSLMVGLFANGNNEVKEPTEKKPVTLIFWGGVPAETGPGQVVDRFNKEFADKGIQVEYNRYVNDAPGNLKLDVSLMGGSDIDLYISYGYEKYAKRSSNMALNLSPYLTKDSYNVEKMIGPAADKKSQVDGKYFGLASKTYNNGFLVNKDMFDAAGIEIPSAWTWDEFVATAKKLSYGEGLDHVYGAYANTTWNPQAPLEFLEAELGADYIYNQAGTKVDLSNPKIARAVEMFSDMMSSGAMPSQQDAVSQKISGTSLFINKKLAMLHGTWSIRDVKNLKKYPHDFVTGYIPFPSDAPKNSPYYMVGGPGDMVQINKNSKNSDAAWTFMKWYIETGLLEMAPFGRFPLYTGTDMKELANTVLAGVEEYFDNESIVKGFLTPAKDYSVPFKTDPTVTKILKEELEAVYYGVKTVEEALSDAEEAANKALADK